MSNSSPVTNESLAPSNPDPESQHGRSLILRSVKGPAQFLSFWVAIALPFVHLPLLAQGLGDPEVTLAFVVLLAANVFALYLGHGYNQY